MTFMSKHSRDEDVPKHRTAAPAAWLVLGTMGLASVVFQIDHALGGGLPRQLIAGIIGFAPVAVSLGVAHMIALHKGGKLVRFAALAVMATGMALSIGAIGWVVAPYYHSNLRWLFGLLLDGAALFAAWVLLSEHERRASVATALEVAQRSEREARDELARLSGDMEALRAELETARQERAAVLERSAVLGARSPRRAKRAPASRRSAAQELGVEAKALEILARTPGLTGKELGAELGVSEGYGRKLKARLGGTAEHETGPLPRVES